MAKMISEFIQEQETGYSTSSDNFVKSYAEAAAAISLAQCYVEHASLAAFAAANDVDTLCITEAAEEEPKKNIFQRAGGAIKNAWKKFIEFIKGIVKKIKDWFRGKKVESVEKAIAELSPDTEIEVDANILYPSLVAAICKAMSATLTNATGNLPNLKSKLKEDVEDIRKINDGEAGTIKALLKDAGIYSELDIKIKNGRISCTIGQYKALIKSYRDTNTDKMMSEILNQLARVETEFGKFIDTVGGGYDDEADEKEYQSTAKADVTQAMKEFMNGLAKLNEKAINYMNKIDEDVNNIIKAAKGDNGLGAKLKYQESAYFV